MLWHSVSAVAEHGLISICPGGHCVHRLHFVLCVSVQLLAMYLFVPHALHALGGVGVEAEEGTSDTARASANRCPWLGRLCPPLHHTPALARFQIKPVALPAALSVLFARGRQLAFAARHRQARCKDCPAHPLDGSFLQAARGLVHITLCLLYSHMCTSPNHRYYLPGCGLFVARETWRHIRADAVIVRISRTICVAGACQAALLGTVGRNITDVMARLGKKQHPFLRHTSTPLACWGLGIHAGLSAAVFLAHKNMRRHICL